MLVVLGGNSGVVPDADYLSPLALVADQTGEKLYVAEYTGKQIAVFDTVSGKVAKTISLPDEPSGLTLAPDGSRLYVTGASPEGQVYVIDLRTGKITDRISVGHTPCAPVVSPNGKMLYVCNRFDNDIAVIDLTTNKQVAKIPVSREPVAAAITPDGRKLFVSNFLPADSADGDYVAGSVTVIDTASKKMSAAIPFINGSTDLHGICVSPDGKHVYATCILARYQQPTTQLERGWSITNALAVIDAAQEKMINTVLLDNMDLGAANPWGITCTGDGKYICITLAGTHEISVIDRQSLHEKLNKVASGVKASSVSVSAEDVPNDLAFLVGLHRRLQLAGKGPRGLTTIGTKVYAAEYFTDSIAVVDIDNDINPEAKTLALGPQNPLTEVRKGEILFHDGSLCFQKWLSCASCHPGQARVDALNWDLLNDGLGNAKSTKSLLLSHETPPAMITGIRQSAEVAVRAGMKYIQFAVCTEEDATAIDEYLKSLKSIPSPYLVKGKLSPAAKRGEKIFQQADCSVCHPAPLYTDMRLYNVGTGTGREIGREFDTPTLMEIWRTSPYLYDGRAVTIEDVLTKFNKDNRHGTTSKLTEKQIADLVEFVLSL